MSFSGTAGPSSSPSPSSSPVVPPSARNLRVNKRVVNLVNPADPNDFSAQSMSPNASSELSMSERQHEQPQSQRGERESTPLLQLHVDVPAYTPLGVDRNGVKGILRPSGTPGSGNGVRFFPKNKFRVITPNHSLAKPPPSPTSTSFLSQLLAVTMPSMSPRRDPPPKVHDESWEVPGQEGEISLVASSITSSLQEIQEEEHEDQDDDGHENSHEHDVSDSRDRWDGVPETHSSPLGLPISELPSLEMRVPEDMSNLLSQQFSGIGMDSDTFSASEFQPYSKGDDSARSAGTDENPTIRRPLPPLEEPAQADAAKPPESIFADMSAEQAELSWPLIRPRSDTQVVDEDTRFHSMVEEPADFTTSPLPRPSRKPSVTPSLDSRQGASDTTQFFDCIASSPDSALPLSPSPTPALVHSSESTSSLISRRNTPSPMLMPTKALFEAHNSLTTSLRAELELYKSLAGKLHAEVSERDNALGELNLRCLESEGWRLQLEAAQAEVSRLKTRQPQSPMLLGLRDNANMSSPTPMRRTSSADRTTVAESEQRDLEIRLAKAMSEQSSLVKQIEQGRVERERLKIRLEETEHRAIEAEQKDRDEVVKRQRQDEEREARAVDALRRLEDMEYQLSEARDGLAEAQRDCEAARGQVEALKEELGDTQRSLNGADDELDRVRDALEQVKQERDAAQQEIAQLREDVDQARSDAKRSEETSVKLAELERQLETERYHREEAERAFVDAKSGKEHLEEELHQLQEELRTARAEVTLTSAPKAVPDEVHRLRAESASKDLEIVKLQRRKAELKEDREMLNIALSSKQQELELVKRKFGVAGIAGSTPLGNSRRVSTVNAPTPMGDSVNTPIAKGGNRRTSARMSSSLVTPAPRHGVKLHPITATVQKDRLLRRPSRTSVPEEEVENRPPPQEMVQA